MVAFLVLKFKTKMQIEIIRTKSGGTPRYRNVFHAGRVIFSEYGIRGVFQGLKATSVRDTPACGIYFGETSASIWQ
jgi:Mitochondrial carrier protein